jgi:hypothetical protein
MPYTPLAGAQYGLPPTSVTRLTVPPGTRYATVCAESGTIRYTTSGTAPTTSAGMPLDAGSCMSLSGPQVLANFQAIQAINGSGTLDVEFFR